MRLLTTQGGLPRISWGSVIAGVTQRVQGAIASATAEASGPQAEADARQAADTAARGVARASWFSFAALVVGAIISIVSGHAGFRHQPPFEEAGGASADDVALRRNQALEQLTQTGIARSNMEGEVQTGGVPVYSRATETPISEAVTLREEHAMIERYPVDRIATALHGDEAASLPVTRP
jgi:hypothetical protein